MEQYHILNLNVQLSLVVSLIDAYTGQGIEGSYTSVYLEHWSRKPVKKNGGIFVFTDLPKISFRVHIKSQWYFDESVEVDLRELAGEYPQIQLTLIPRPAYPFKEDATLIRLALRDQQDQPLPYVQMRAVVVSEECQRARLAEESPPGSTELCLAQLKGKIAVGDTLWLKSKQQQQREFCTIAETEYGSKYYPLTKPIEQPFSRGTLLLPVVQARSDERGETVVALRNYRSKQVEVNLEILDSNDDVVKVKEVSMEEGTMSYLGVIKL